jgi:hypothetical protein
MAERGLSKPCDAGPIPVPHPYESSHAQYPHSILEHEVESLFVTDIYA